MYDNPILNNLISNTHSKYLGQNLKLSDIDVSYKIVVHRSVILYLINNKFYKFDFNVQTLKK